MSFTKHPTPGCLGITIPMFRCLTLFCLQNSGFQKNERNIHSPISEKGLNSDVPKHLGAVKDSFRLNY